MMKTNKYGLPALFLLAEMSLASTASAALIDRGSGLIYDNDFNITWLANANLAATKTFNVSGINSDGTMAWWTAQSWVTAMNNADYLGYNDWRLPTTAVPDTTCEWSSGYGLYCTGSDMGHMFYNNLGGQAGTDISAHHNSNYSLFSNIQQVYWSATELASNPDGAWLFTTTEGRQLTMGKANNWVYAWAVRSGDVAAVPLPATIWLFGSALTGLMVACLRGSQRG